MRSGFHHPNTRIFVKLLGPCFKTGRLKPFWQDRPWASLRPIRSFPAQLPIWCWEAFASWLLRERSDLASWRERGVKHSSWTTSTSPMKYSTLVASNAHSPSSRPNNNSLTASFSTTSSLLTLFSKFFSSFLRSTCSLSVSHQYLALEEVYLPFRAAIPNNPTLRRVFLRLLVSNYGVVSLFDALFQGTYVTKAVFGKPL